MSIEWLNTPCTDPIGRVFRTDGRIYRALFKQQAAAALSILTHDAIRALMDEQLIARMWRADIAVPEYGPVIEIEVAPFDVPCGRFSRSALRSAAIKWLTISRRLLEHDLALSDAHFGNFMLFGHNDPRWIDLGSIHPRHNLPPEQPFPGFLSAWNNLIGPLVLMHEHPDRDRLARLSIFDQPYQGPKTADGEPALAVDDFIENERKKFIAAHTRDTVADLIDSMIAYVGALSKKKKKPAPPQVSLPAPLADHLAEKLRAGRATSVTCIGATSFLALAPRLPNLDVLVVDFSNERLEAVGIGLQLLPHLTNVSLYLDHPINRFFLRDAPLADAVVALDPFGQLAHSSAVEDENIIFSIRTLARHIGIVITPDERRERTSRALSQAAEIKSATFDGFHVMDWDWEDRSKDTDTTVQNGGQGTLFADTFETKLEKLTDALRHQEASFGDSLDALKLAIHLQEERLKTDLSAFRDAVGTKFKNQEQSLAAAEARRTEAVERDGARFVSLTRSRLETLAQAQERSARLLEQLAQMIESQTVEQQARDDRYGARLQALLDLESETEIRTERKIGLLISQVELLNARVEDSQSKLDAITAMFYRLRSTALFRILRGLGILR